MLYVYIILVLVFILVAAIIIPVVLLRKPKAKKPEQPEEMSNEEVQPPVQEGHVLDEEQKSPIDFDDVVDSVLDSSENSADSVKKSASDVVYESRHACSSTTEVMHKSHVVYNKLKVLGRSYYSYANCTIYYLRVKDTYTGNTFKTECSEEDYWSMGKSGWYESSFYWHWERNKDDDNDY